MNQNNQDKSLKVCPQALEEQINSAKDLLSKRGVVNGLVPCVFGAMQLDGTMFFGVNYHEKGVAVGDRFHFDHGVGIHKNNDGKILWTPAAEGLV